MHPSLAVSEHGAANFIKHAGKSFTSITRCFLFYYRAQNLDPEGSELIGHWTAGPEKANDGL